jgi:hypothetical protein
MNEVMPLLGGDEFELVLGGQFGHLKLLNDALV